MSENCDMDSDVEEEVRKQGKVKNLGKRCKKKGKIQIRGNGL